MSQTPLISVGIPVFNSEKTIRRCLDAIASQTYQNIEIIISDNNSTDGTYGICERYASSDKRITLYRQEENKGIVANFKFVFQKSKGKYFFWAAGDDFWERQFVEYLQNALAKTPNAVAAHCEVLRIFPDGWQHDCISFKGKTNITRLSTFQLLYLLLSSKTRIRNLKYNLFINGLICRNALDEVVKKYSFLQGDRILVAALALQGNFVFVPEPLMYKTIYRKRARDTSDAFFVQNQEDRLDYLLQAFSLYYKLKSVPLYHKLVTLPALCAVFAQERKARKAIIKRIKTLL